MVTLETKVLQLNNAVNFSASSRYFVDRTLREWLAKEARSLTGAALLATVMSGNFLAACRHKPVSMFTSIIRREWGSGQSPASESGPAATFSFRLALVERLIDVFSPYINGAEWPTDIKFVNLLANWGVAFARPSADLEDGEDQRPRAFLCRLEEYLPPPLETDTIRFRMIFWVLGAPYRGAAPDYAMNALLSVRVSTPELQQAVDQFPLIYPQPPEPPEPPSRVVFRRRGDHGAAEERRCAARSGTAGAVPEVE